MQTGKKKKKEKKESPGFHHIEIHYVRGASFFVNQALNDLSSVKGA